jgi:adhesin/invasin
MTSGIEFIVPPSAVRAGADLSPGVQVEIVDGSGDRIRDATYPITIALDNAQGAILSGTLTQPANAGIAVFPDLSIDKIGQGYRLTATGNGWTADSPPFDVTAGAPAALDFSMEPGSTASEGTIQATVTLVDALGNVETGSTAQVSLAIGTHAGLGTLTGTKTVPAVGGVARFIDLHIDKSGMGYTLAATASGYAGAISSTFDITAGAANAATSTLALTTAPIAANGSATCAITVTVRDAQGNPVGGQVVSLAASGQSDTLSAATVTTDASGVASATLASTHAETKTVSATVGSFMLSGMATFVASDVNAADSSLTVAPNSAPADGITTETVTVTLADAGGNPLVNTAVSLSASGSGNHFAATTGTTDAAGHFVTTLTATVAQNETLSAYVGGVVVVTAPASFVSGPADQAHSTVTATGMPTADGIQAVAITVHVGDSHGNPVAGQAVTLAATGTQNTLTPASGTTDANGALTATLASTKAETKTISATIGSFAVMATATFVPGPLSMALSTFVVTPSSVPADGVSHATLTFTARDAHGNWLPGLSTRFAATGSSNTINPTSALTSASGVATATLGSTTAETKTVSAQISSATFNQSVNFTASPAAARSTIVASPTWILANGTAKTTITVTVRDGAGAPFGNAQVALGVSGTGNTLSLASGTTNTSGLFSAQLASTQAELKTVTATIGGTFGLTVQVLVGSGCSGPVLLPGVPGINTAPARSQALALADLNGDNLLDIVSGDSDSAVRTYIGHGDGTFSPGSELVETGRVVAVALADFNGDRVVDIATAVTGTGVDLFLGKGDGSFQPVSHVSTNTATTSVYAADMNRDTKADLLTTASSGFLNTFLGQGNGTFAQPSSIGVGSGPVQITAADFNGDGKLDAATVNSMGNSVSVTLGNGDGTYASAVANVAVGLNPMALTSGDLDGDGHIDIAVANQGSDTLSVLHGAGDGSFTVTTSSGLTAPRGVALSDINQDGKPDILVMNGSGMSPFDFASGAITSVAGGFSLGWDPDGLTVADLNRDGKNDYVYNDDGIVTVLLATIPVPAAIGSGSRIRLADMNADGRADVVLATIGGADVLISNADGTYGQGGGLTAGQPTGLVVTDFNRDGILDVAVLSYMNSSVAVALGNGDGTLGAQANYPAGTTYPAGLLAIDVDGDGNLDLVDNGGISGSAELRGNGDGTFQAATATTPFGSFGSAIVVDVNKDGHPDLVTPTTAFLFAGGGTFTAKPTVTGSVTNVAAGDWNGDGKVDLAIAAYSGVSTSIAVATGNGDGTFNSFASLLWGQQVIAMNAADLNGDGYDDILATTSTVGVMVFYSKGDGSFVQGLYPTLQYPGDISVADVNHDGRPDVAISGSPSSFGSGRLPQPRLRAVTAVLQRKRHDEGGARARLALDLRVAAVRDHDLARQP